MSNPPINLDVQFTNFAKYVVKTGREADNKIEKPDGSTIKLRQIDFWFEQAKLFNRNLTRTDTGLAYIEFQAGSIQFSEFLIFLDNLACSKQLDLEQIKEKLMRCGLPGAIEKKPKPADSDKSEKTDK